MEHALTTDDVERTCGAELDLFSAGRFVVCIAVAALLLRLLGPAWQTGFPQEFADSWSYGAVAESGPISWDFWFGQKPPTYPLLIWLFGPSTRAVIVAQTLLAFLSWGWLLSTARTMIRSRSVAIVAIVLIIAIAIQTRWNLWHAILLPESLSATLAVGGIAAWWRWWGDPTRFRTGAATLLTLAWMMTHDSNAITLLAVIGPAFVVVIVMGRRATRPRQRTFSIALAVLIAAGAYSVTAQIVSDRSETSFANDSALSELDAFTSNDLRAYDSFGVADRFPERTLGPIDPAGSPPSMYVWGLLVVMGICLRWVRRRIWAWFSLFLLTTVISDLFLVSVADAADASRQLVGPMLRFSVVAVVVTALAVDEAVTGLRKQDTDG